MADKLTLSTKQQYFLDEIEAGKNVFLTGKAGTGKSYIVKKAIERLKSNGKNVIALAPTGIAANNISGQTMHSFFSLQPYGVLDFGSCKYLKSEKKRLINLLDVIFIDEVSMLRPDMLDAINLTLVKNSCKSLKDIQLIFIGDMKQLPAPMDDNFLSVLLSRYKDYNFYDSNFYQKIEIETIELDKVLRQSNEDFISALNIIREGGKSEYFKTFLSKHPRGIILAAHNETVAQYNTAGYELQQGKEYHFSAIVEGNVKAGDFNFESEVKVKDGCKILYLINSKNNNLINGTLGIFRVVNGKFFIDVNGVKYGLEEYKLAKKEYVLNENQDGMELREIGSITQMPIKLAYALTIHKSQGLTFDEVTIDLSRPCFVRGQLYVALSRVKTPEGLNIIVNR